MVLFAVLAHSKVNSISAIEIDSRINPNNASAANLTRLPGIGITRAGAIIAYRQSWVEQNNSLAFETYDDLESVKRYGAKTVNNIKQWLTFD